jgi:hypothetical protein
LLLGLPTIAITSTAPSFTPAGAVTVHCVVEVHSAAVPGLLEIEGGLFR